MQATVTCCFYFPATDTLTMRRRLRLPRLTLFGGSVAIIAAEVTVNAVLWVVACLLFIPDPAKRRVMSLALVAWTLGLRHGLDVDHISAIDNATRHLVSLGKLPLAVGTFFSLGHSTIVVVATVAITVSTSIADHLDGISSVGGIIGVSISASFLLLVALINAFILWTTLKQRSASRRLQQQSTSSDVDDSNPDKSKSDRDEGDVPLSPGQFGCIGKIAGPLFKTIDSSWKMYPIGVLFGLGFDTSSEIALLAVSALAKNSIDGSTIPHSQILILPCLFTGGMSLVDALDSVFMLWCYAVPKLDPTVSKWSFFERRTPHQHEAQSGNVVQTTGIEEQQPQQSKISQQVERLQIVKAQTMSSLSIVLTIISIAVALLISIVEFMGLAAEKCSKCARDAEHDPGLSGRWWRFWISVNDQSGYLGAGVVGIMFVTAVGWLGWHYGTKRRSTTV